MGVFGLGSVTANASTYTVKSGDTVSAVAQKFDTTTNTIAKQNNLSDVNVIYVGEKLSVNETENQTAPQTPSREQTVTASTQQNQTPQQTTVKQSVNTNTASSSAENQIAQAESGGSWNARNGQYIGKFQISSSYLHGDYSPANQEKVFHQYCNDRYGSVQNALSFRQSHGWY